MDRNGQNSTFSQTLNLNFEIPMGCFLFEYKFWWHFRQDLYEFWAKNRFCNRRCLEFWDQSGWGWTFIDKTPKNTS